MRAPTNSPAIMAKPENRTGGQRGVEAAHVAAAGHYRAHAHEHAADQALDELHFGGVAPGELPRHQGGAEGPEQQAPSKD